MGSWPLKCWCGSTLENALGKEASLAIMSEFWTELYFFLSWALYAQLVATILGTNKQMSIVKKTSVLFSVYLVSLYDGLFAYVTFRFSLPQVDNEANKSVRCVLHLTDLCCHSKGSNRSLKRKTSRYLYTVLSVDWWETSQFIHLKSNVESLPLWLQMISEFQIAASFSGSRRRSCCVTLTK